MRRLLVGISVVIVAGLLAPGCGRKSPEEKEAEKAAKQLEKLVSTISEKSGGKDAAAGMEGLQKAVEAAQKGAAEGAKVELVDFRELKALLPEKLGGMKRSDMSGEKTGAFGMSLSTAEATYQDGQGGSIEAKITDLGGMGAVGAMAQLSWAAADFDRETDRGYEKTTKFEGFRAMEQYDKETKRGNLHLIVKSRFHVEVNGENVSMDLVKSAMKSIPLNKLQGMGK